MNPEYEEHRILALRRFGILDTAPEKVFDGITRAIANICGVPIALVSLVDIDRQWFKSAYGLNVQQTPRDVAFCSHAITRPDELMTVEDAELDPRFKNNPLVTQDPSIRFYAGKPIVSADGYAVGTLCVIDRKPRQLNDQQLNALDALGETVSQILADREQFQKTALDRNSAEDALHQNIAKLQENNSVFSNTIETLVAEIEQPSAVIGSAGEVLHSNGPWKAHFRGSPLGKNTDAGGNSEPANLRDVSVRLAAAMSVEVDDLYEKLSTFTERNESPSLGGIDLPMHDGRRLRVVTNKNEIANPLIQILESA